MKPCCLLAKQDIENFKDNKSVEGITILACAHSHIRYHEAEMYDLQDC